jgi:hypothetical protein
MHARAAHREDDSRPMHAGYRIRFTYAHECVSLQSVRFATRRELSRSPYIARNCFPLDFAAASVAGTSTEQLMNESSAATLLDHKDAIAPPYRYRVVSGCRFNRYVSVLWTSPDVRGARGGELGTTVPRDSQLVCRGQDVEPYDPGAAAIAFPRRHG